MSATGPRVLTLDSDGRGNLVLPLPEEGPYAAGQMVTVRVEEDGSLLVRPVDPDRAMLTKALRYAVADVLGEAIGRDVTDEEADLVLTSLGGYLRAGVAEGARVEWDGGAVVRLEEDR